MDSAWIPLPSLKTPNWQNNLAFLQSSNHELLSLFKSIAFRESLIFQKQEQWICCRSEEDPPVWIIGETNVGEEISKLHEGIFAKIADTRLLIAVGGAVGYVAAALIPTLLENPDLHVVVVEPTPDRIYASFALVDLAAALATERLHFLIGDLTGDRVFRAMEKLNLWDLAPVSVFLSPELKGKVDPQNFLDQYADFARQAIEKRRRFLASLSELRLNAGKIERAMIVNCWEGAPGGLHVQSIEHLLKIRQIQTRILSLNRRRFDRAAKDYRRSVELYLMQCFREYRPNLILSFGYHAPQFVQEDAFDSMNTRWLQMVSNIAYYDEEQYEGEWTFLAEERMIPIFLRRGYRRAFFHPLAANYVSPAPIQSNGRFPLIILGNSLALPEEEVAQFWERWKGRDALIQYLRNAEPALAAFDAQSNIYDFLEENPMPQMENERERYLVFRYLLSQSSAVRRIQILERLAPLGLHVFGGGWERSLSPNSPLRPCLHGYLPISEEPKIFSQGTIFINTHTIGNDTGPNMRFFNVAGMGAFQISDCPQFERYLSPDSEMVYCSTLQDYEEKARHYLAHPEERDPIRERAQKRVRENWTYEHWLDRVLAKLV